MDMGNWAPYNRDMVASYGADAAIFFSELCRLAEQFKASENEFWFYASAETLIEKTGFTERKVESAIATLCKADLIMIDKRPPFNRRHFRIVQNADDFMAAISIATQTPDRAPKTAPRPKQAANTAKETIDQSDRPLEMVEPVGKTEQLPTEKPKKPKANTAEIDAAAVRLIEHFNAVAGTAFRTTGKANIECFGRVLKSKQGTEEEIRMVIELKTMQWANNENMKSHLNPETLTRPKNFPRYLEECYNAKAQQSTPRPAVGGSAARDNNTIFNKSDARIAAMVMGQLQEHPGMANFLDPKFTKVEYLIALSESEIRHHLREAKRKWELSKYSSTNDDGLPF